MRSEVIHVGHVRRVSIYMGSISEVGAEVEAGQRL